MKPEGTRPEQTAVTQPETVADQPARDAARLDWLEAWHDLRPDLLPGYGDCGLDLIIRGSDGWRIDDDVPNVAGTEHDTLREAIDAAMSAPALKATP